MLLPELFLTIASGSMILAGAIVMPLAIKKHSDAVVAERTLSESLKDINKNK